MQPADPVTVLFSILLDSSGSSNHRCKLYEVLLDLPATLFFKVYGNGLYSNRRTVVDGRFGVLGLVLLGSA